MTANKKFTIELEIQEKITYLTDIGDLYVNDRTLWFTMSGDLGNCIWSCNGDLFIPLKESLCGPFLTFWAFIYDYFQVRKQSNPFSIIYI